MQDSFLPSLRKRSGCLIGGVILLFLVLVVIALLLSVRLGRRPDGTAFQSLSYYSNGQFISPDPIQSFPDKVTGGSIGFGRFFKKSSYAPKHPLPKIMLEQSSFTSIPSDYAIYWLGHSAAIMELDGYRILVDPVLHNAGPLPGITPRYDRSPLSEKYMPSVDVVLITHDHYDHLEYSTIRSLRNQQVLFVVPLGVGARLQGWGVPPERIRELGWGDVFKYNTITITAETGIHYSGRSYNDRNTTLWASYIIKGKQQNIFWSGDTGYGTHFTRIGEEYGPFDLAVIEIDGWNPGWPNTHLFPEEAVKATREVKANRILPVHWGVFDLALHPWDESIRELVRFAKADSVELITPLMGEKVIPGITSTDYWWEKL